MLDIFNNKLFIQTFKNTVLKVLRARVQCSFKSTGKNKKKTPNKQTTTTTVIKKKKKIALN